MKSVCFLYNVVRYSEARPNLNIAPKLHADDVTTRRRPPAMVSIWTLNNSKSVKGSQVLIMRITVKPCRVDGSCQEWLRWIFLLFPTSPPNVSHTLDDHGLQTKYDPASEEPPVINSKTPACLLLLFWWSSNGIEAQPTISAQWLVQHRSMRDLTKTFHQFLFQVMAIGGGTRWGTAAVLGPDLQAAVKPFQSFSTAHCCQSPLLMLTSIPITWWTS